MALVSSQDLSESRCPQGRQNPVAELTFLQTLRGGVHPELAQPSVPGQTDQWALTTEGLGSLARAGGMAGAAAGWKGGVPGIKYLMMKSDCVQGKPEQELSYMLTFS